MTDKTEQKAEQPVAEKQEQAAKEHPKEIFVHELRVFLVGGQTFSMREVTDSQVMPNNVIAFINAWRQKRDVWHSPNNDPHFGVRVKDVALYEYGVRRAERKNPEEEPAQEGGAKKETKKK